MQQVAEGDFSVRLETEKQMKEIRDIYSNFNLMVQELEATEILQTDFVSNVPTNSKLPSVLLRVMQLCCRMMTCYIRRAGAVHQQNPF